MCSLFAPTMLASVMPPMLCACHQQRTEDCLRGHASQELPASQEQLDSRGLRDTQEPPASQELPVSQVEECIPTCAGLVMPLHP